MMKKIVYMVATWAIMLIASTTARASHTFPVDSGYVESRPVVTDTTTHSPFRYDPVVADSIISIFHMRDSLFFSLRNNRVDVDSIATDTLLPIDSIVEIVSPIKEKRTFERGLTNYSYIAKNEWICGITASYTGFNSDDSDLLLLIKDFNFTGSLFGINPFVGYFVADNQCIGIKLGYSSTVGNLGNFSLDIIEGMNISLTDLEYNAKIYSAGLFHRAYLGLTPGGQLGIFNETNLTFRNGVSHFIRSNGEGGMTDTKTISNEIVLGLSPGISVFIMDNVGASVSVGILGLNYKHNVQYIDGALTGKFVSSGANFQINILNINIGITVHI